MAMHVYRSTCTAQVNMEIVFEGRWGWTKMVTFLDNTPKLDRATAKKGYLVALNLLLNIQASTKTYSFI